MSDLRCFLGLHDWRSMRFREARWYSCVRCHRVKPAKRTVIYGRHSTRRED